jgi:DNA-binding SARP family transcriptional activator/predicted ATPase
MLDELRLTALGRPQITLGGIPVTGFSYRKSLALLYYLAVTGRPHSRETLLGLLWPETAEASARSSLRKTLTDLRKRVGPFLDITRHEVAFDFNTPYWLDTECFETSVKDTTAESIERLQEAAELYRGDFLEGFYIRKAAAFEEWVLVQRARLRETALRTLETLGRIYGAQGASGRAAAIDYTARLLALEPWREEAHRQLMHLLAVSGRRGAAMAHYEICRQTLADELDIEPGPDTIRLYERIRDGDIQVEEHAFRPQEHRSPVTALEATPLTPEEVPEPNVPPFVAREGELARLDACLDAALNGQSRVVFLTGGPGRGKTALMQAFARRAMGVHSDLLVAIGKCNAYSGVGDPYLPFRQVLGALTGDITDALSREHAQRLWAALPLTVQVLLERGPHLIDSLVPGPPLLSRVKAAVPAEGNGWLRKLMEWVERDRAAAVTLEPNALLAQAADTLCAMAERFPLLLMLDDLHWSDTGSSSLLFHLGRQLAEGGRHTILVLGAYRPEEISLGQSEPGEERGPLWQVLAEFGRYFGDVSFDLTELDEAENRRLVDQMVDAEPNRLGERFRAALYDRTHGHALFTVELLRAMQERGELVQEGGFWVEGPSLDWGRLPARVEAVIAGRLGHLDQKHSEMLAVASVEGETFTAQVLAEVLDIPEWQALRALSFELGRRHLLVQEAGEERIGERYFSRFRFAHALYQEYVYNRLSPGERRLLHYRIGTVLERLYGDRTGEVAVRLAMHFADADVAAKAWDYFGQAGDGAASVYASAEAIDHYRRALEWAKHCDIGSEDLIRLYTGLGRAYELNSEFGRAVAVYEEMEAMALQRGDRALELAALIAPLTIQSVPSAVQDPARAQAQGTRALVLAEDLGDQEAEARILGALALACFFDHEPAEALDYGERSLALARKQDLRQQMAQTLNDMGSLCYLYNGQIARSISSLRSASDLWRELGNLPMLADSLSSSAAAHAFAGAYDQAIVYSREASEISKEIGNLWGQSYALWKVGFAYWERGEPSLAVSTMQECIQLGKLAGFVSPLDHTQADLAAVYGDLGAMDLALDTVQRAVSSAEESNPSGRAHGLGVMASLNVSVGNLAKAEWAIAEGKNEASRESFALFQVLIMIAEAELRLRKGEHRQAQAATDDLLARSHTYGLRSQLPYALFLRGWASMGVGETESARSFWTEALAEAEALGSRRILWRVLHALSQIEQDPIQAERLLSSARDVLAYIIDHIVQRDLRESFLKRSDVRAVLE